MSYSLALNGHGADPDDVKEIFENAVRALRKVSPEGSTPIYGSLTADGISLQAADVGRRRRPGRRAPGRRRRGRPGHRPQSHHNGRRPIVKIFGREPTLWLAVLSSLVILLGTFGLHVLTNQQAALIVVAINALFGAINAYAVRPISPWPFTYAVGSLVALVAAYGVNLPIETVASLNAAIIPILALLSRGQVSPAETAISKS